MTEPFRLSQHFHEYFEAVPANDETTRSEVFRLRYDVYCDELHFEDSERFPEHEERDEYDEHSVFALLRHRETGRAAGCVRLVLNHKDPTLALPLERVCTGLFDLNKYNPETIDRARVGEISRLAVHSFFRRRRGESTTPEGTAEPASYFGGERHYPLVAMGLFLSSAAYMFNLDLEQIVVMMEPRLARLLRSCGLHFTAIGPVIEYHGQRGPFRITRADVEAHLGEEANELLRTLLPIFR